MRQALTLALQTFEGAMVIVSHDRYLLRATTDDLYLVHNKQVAPFDGDLNHYYKWLTDQQKAERREAKHQLKKAPQTVPPLKKSKSAAKQSYVNKPRRFEKHLPNWKLRWTV